MNKKRIRRKKMTYEILEILTIPETSNLNYLNENSCKIHEIIAKTNKRYYENIGKIKINNFYFEFLNGFNKIAKEIEYNKEDIEFHLTHIDNYFNDLNSYLIIKNSKDIEYLNTAIRICEIVLDESVEQNDIECLFQAINLFKSKIANKKLIDN